MDLLSPKTIKELLAKYDAAPLKIMGQNFLINRGILKKIIETANLDKEDVVLEIGPGLGSLTQELARAAKKVIAIEKDRKFVEILKETMKEYDNVEIIEGDILKFQISNNQFPKKYKLIANLPYYITSPVIRKFLENTNRPEEMLLMVQKEVAQRICASPVRSSAGRSEGGKAARMSLLSVSVQFYAEPKIISYVSKSSFWPQPKVDSAILRLTPKATPTSGLHPDDQDKNIRVDASGLPEPEGRGRAFRVLFFRIVKAGFSAPRKQLAGNLAKGLKIDRYIIEAALKKAKIDPTQRAETLSVEEWIKLMHYLK